MNQMNQLIAVLIISVVAGVIVHKLTKDDSPKEIVVHAPNGRNNQLPHITATNASNATNPAIRN